MNRVVDSIEEFDDKAGSSPVVLCLVYPSLSPRPYLIVNQRKCHPLIRTIWAVRSSYSIHTNMFSDQRLTSNHSGMLWRNIYNNNDVSVGPGIVKLRIKSKANSKDLTVAQNIWNKTSYITYITHNTYHTYNVVMSVYWIIYFLVSQPEGNSMSSIFYILTVCSHYWEENKCRIWSICWLLSTY